jgi:hypothetical protein
MKSADQVKKDFMADFDALLKKYGASIEAKDEYPGYAECGEDIHIRIDIPSIYGSGCCDREGTDIDLGTYYSL